MDAKETLRVASKLDEARQYEFADALTNAVRKVVSFDQATQLLKMYLDENPSETHAKDGYMSGYEKDWDKKAPLANPQDMGSNDLHDQFIAKNGVEDYQKTEDEHQLNINALNWFNQLRIKNPQLASEYYRQVYEPQLSEPEYPSEDGLTEASDEFDGYNTAMESFPYLNFKKYVPNDHIIHFSSHSGDIEQNGVHSPGFNYGFNSDHPSPPGGLMLGTKGVIFPGHSLKVQHNINDDDYALFHGPSIKVEDIVRFERKDGKIHLYDATGHVRHKSATYSDAIEWLKNNQDMMRNIKIKQMNQSKLAQD